MSIMVCLFIFELSMYFLLRHPEVLRRCSRKLQNSIGYLYIQGERKIMHFQEGCSHYHPELGYTLKPGSFVLSETEFSNEYKINSLGLRDSEENLNAPEILILGNSYALGWGVDQEMTFSKKLEAKTKCRTLNTSVPAYGTVREMLMFRKIDRSQLKCLVLQYWGNDNEENSRYFMNNNVLQIMRPETFVKFTELHSKEKKYFLGKYIQLKYKKKVGEWKNRSNKTPAVSSLSDVDLFINVLKQNSDLLKGLPIIVFEMNGINQTNTFTQELKKKTSDKEQPDFIQRMIVIDMAKYLKDENFYILDGHLNNTGHEVVADAICRILLENDILL